MKRKQCGVNRSRDSWQQPEVTSRYSVIERDIPGLSTLDSCFQNKTL